MTIVEAIEIVENFNKNGTNKNEEITKAIDVVLEVSKKAIKIALKDIYESGKIDLNKNRFQ